MICPGCRLWISAGGSTCDVCGAVLRQDHAGFELVLPDKRRFVLDGCVTVGRSNECTVQLEEPSVSRMHARILAAIDPPVLEDVGSSNGTYLNGVAVRGGGAALTEGAVLHLGDAELRVERIRPTGERTVRVTGGPPPSGADVGPRLRAGLRIASAPGPGGGCMVATADGTELVRVDGPDAALLERLDGAHSTERLLRDARRERGSWGVGRLVQLIALLADRGMLDGVDPAPDPPRPGLARRILRGREWTLPRAAHAFTGAYRRGGFLLLTPLGLSLLALVACAGAAAFVGLIVAHDATPLVVGGHLAYGAAIFIAGRLAIVALHEFAHGLVLTSFGYRVDRAGIKLIAGIPFGFVDSSQALLDHRRRRVAVSAAGPACDLVLGGAFAIAGLLLGQGTGAELAFQLALAAYVGAAINLNPLLDRDGQHILEDLLEEPGLRIRSRRTIRDRLAGRDRGAGGSRAVAAYGVAALAWTAALAGLLIWAVFAVEARLTALLPSAVVWTGFAVVSMLLLAPLAIQLLPPLVARRRRTGSR